MGCLLFSTIVDCIVSERNSLMNQRKAGIILSYTAQIIHILSGILYTPIMLRLLGQSEYGLYQLVYSTVAYLNLLSFGFSSSYLRFYSRYKAKNDHQEIARLNGMFMTIFMCISCVCILCGSVLTGNIEHIFAGGLTMAEYQKARILMILMIFNLAMTFPNSVFDSFTSAHEQFFFQKMLLVLQYLFNPFITLPLLLMGYGSVAMVCVTTGLTIVKLITNIGFCVKKLHVQFVFRNFNFVLLKEMWVFTFFIFINMIVDQINWSIDKFLLGRFDGTVAVAIYGVGAQLNTLYLQLSTSISSVFVPKVNRIVAETNDNYVLTQLFTKVGRVQFIILSLIVSGFVFLGRPFIQIWAGNGYGVSYGIALLLMIPVTIPLIQNLGVDIQRAKNMHKARSIVYLFIAISNIFVSIPCIQRWGARGAAIGTALSLICGNGLFMNWYYQKKIGLDVVYFWKQIARFIPAFIAPVLFGICIIKYISIDGILKFSVCGILYVSVFCASMYFLGMNAEEKQMIIGPLKNILRIQN